MGELEQLRADADAVLAAYEPMYRAKRDVNWRAAKREHEDGHRL